MARIVVDFDGMRLNERILVTFWFHSLPSVGAVVVAAVDAMKERSCSRATVLVVESTLESPATVFDL